MSYEYSQEPQHIKIPNEFAWESLNYIINATGNYDIIKAVEVPPKTERKNGSIYLYNSPDSSNDYAYFHIYFDVEAMEPEKFANEVSRLYVDLKLENRVNREAFLKIFTTSNFEKLH